MNNLKIFLLVSLPIFLSCVKSENENQQINFIEQKLNIGKLFNVGLGRSTPDFFILNTSGEIVYRKTGKLDKISIEEEFLMDESISKTEELSNIQFFLNSLLPSDRRSKKIIILVGIGKSVGSCPPCVDAKNEIITFLTENDMNLDLIYLLAEQQ